MPVATRSTETRSDATREDAIAFGRAVAGSTPEAVRARLLAEHRELAVKAAKRECTRSERARLGLVRWKLERIQEAELGETLDFWEAFAASYREVEDQLSRFSGQVETIAQPPRGGRQERRR